MMNKCILCFGKLNDNEDCISKDCIALKLYDLPDWAERQIMTPHEHEGSHWPPLWIVWKHRTTLSELDDPPAIDCVCTTEKMVRYAFAAMWDERSRMFEGDKIEINIERVPANHRFASSLGDWFYDKTLMMVKAMKHHKTGPSWLHRDGD